MRWMRFVLLWGFSGASFAQSHIVANDAPDWQKAAGGSMSFEVASIRVEEPGKFAPPSFALSQDDWFRDPQGSFHADFGVKAYIEFAYKQMLTGEQGKALLNGLPSWVKTDHFNIQAKAPIGATKDQYRLMMQSLLANRFNLVIHFEEKDMPVLAMVLEKPGQPGPQLVSHEKGLPCAAKPTPEAFPPMCYAIMATPRNGLLRLGSRDQEMGLIASILGGMGDNMDETGRPMVDQTGLTGKWDFDLSFAPTKGKGPGAIVGEPAVDGPSMLAAMAEQLGLKVKPTRAPIRTIVIDHIERPSEN